MTPQQTAESILEQLGARDIIKKHLRYAIHQDVPVTYCVRPLGVRFEAVVSSDHRLRGSFRWPGDDHWVRVIEGWLYFEEDEIERSRGTAARIILARLHQCGIEMNNQVAEYVEVSGDGVMNESRD